MSSHGLVMGQFGVMGLTNNAGRKCTLVQVVGIKYLNYATAKKKRFLAK